MIVGMPTIISARSPSIFDFRSGCASGAEIQDLRMRIPISPARSLGVPHFAGPVARSQWR